MNPKVGDIVEHEQLGRGKVIINAGAQVQVRFESGLAWVWPKKLRKVYERERFERGGSERVRDRLPMGSNYRVVNDRAERQN